MLVLFHLFRLLTLDPVPASYLAVELVETPLTGPELAAIARRESRGRWVSTHEGDRWAEKRVHRRALERGRLSKLCPWHRSPEGMSTRGSFGLMASYSLDFLAPCLPAWVLDIPLISAIAAARRAASRQCAAVPSCRKWSGI